MKALCVVEDDTDMQRLIELVLDADRRLDVAGSAATADEAVRLAGELQPDVVILDHFIDGDVMGLQAAPQIKRAAPDAGILLFTSHDLELEARREPAVDRYLSKSHLDELLPTVQDMTGLEPLAAI